MHHVRVAIFNSSNFGRSFPSSRCRYMIFSLMSFVNTSLTSVTLPLVTISFKKGVSNSKTVSSMSSYQDSTQIPLFGVVCMKFSAKLSMMMVLSRGRPRFRRSLLYRKIITQEKPFLTWHSPRVEWYAVYRGDDSLFDVCQYYPESSQHTKRYQSYHLLTSGIAAVNITIS